MKAAEQEAADRKSAEQHARQKALKFGWNKKVNVTIDEHKAVVVQSRQRKSKCDHAEIYIGNIPVDVDLLSSNLSTSSQKEIAARSGIGSLMVIGSLLTPHYLESRRNWVNSLPRRQAESMDNMSGAYPIMIKTAEN